MLSLSVLAAGSAVPYSWKLEDKIPKSTPAGISLPFICSHLGARTQWRTCPCPQHHIFETSWNEHLLNSLLIELSRPVQKGVILSRIRQNYTAIISQYSHFNINQRGRWTKSWTEWGILWEQCTCLGLHSCNSSLIDTALLFALPHLSPPRTRLGFHVHAFVCQQAYAKLPDGFLMKLGGKTGEEEKRNPLNSFWREGQMQEFVFFFPTVYARTL